MYLTSEFQRAVIGLFLFALLMAGVSVILQINGIYGISITHENSVGRIIAFQSLQLIEIIAFWGAIAYITREKVATIVVVSIQVILLIFTTYLYISKGTSVETIESLRLPRIFLHLLSFTVFGLIHFRRVIGILMILVAVVFTGLSAGFNPSGFYKFINDIFEIFDWDNFMVLNIPGDIGSSRRIDMFSIILRELYLPLQLIVFWFIYTKIKFPKSFNSILSIIPLTDHVSQTTFSVLYWILRLSLFIIAMGIINSLRSIILNGPYYTMYVLVCFCLAVYVVGSAYRNFLVAYFVSKGRYPSWLYLLLQIPLLHIIGWILTFIFKPKPLPVTPGVVVAIETPSKPTSTAMDRVKQARDDYEYSLENRGIKILLIVVLFLIWVIPNELTGEMTGAMRTIGIINFILSIWFIVDRRSLLPLYIIQSVAVLILYLSGIEEMMKPILTFSLVNMVVYYALFHFASFEFIEDNDELLSDSTGSLNNG